MKVSLITRCLEAAAVSYGLSFSTSSDANQQRHLNLEINEVPPPPIPEPIEVTELPLPPVVSTDQEGACTPNINPQGTGCTGIASTFFGGNFLPDGNHVVASLNFTGAPAAPDPASIYTGYELILIKADGTTFPSGSPWKCVTCGVPAEQQAGRNAAMNYPQAFPDGTRVLVGTNIVDCGEAQLASPDCTPDQIHIYPIRWNTEVEGSGPGGAIRELRRHPDGVHLGFNSFTISAAGQTSQFGYFSRLEFNPSPTTGTPLSPRYDLVNVTRLVDPAGPQPVVAVGDQIVINSDAITVGEFRGFSGRGDEASYIGYDAESLNIDVFATNITTGKIRRLTSHPEYCDPVDISPDNNWSVVMDTRGTGRQMWVSGMRGIPPLTDLVSTGAVASTRNNGNRRFFQPWIIDRYGDRGTYIGQKVNEAGDGSPGSVNDPQWNGAADPRWSPDGTKIAYFQLLTVSPACGGQNPLPCPNITASGGRTSRFMLAHLTSRTPLNLPPVETHSDIIPWGVAYEPGTNSTDPYSPPQPGLYTLKGKVSGSAAVNLSSDGIGEAIRTVSVSYTNFSNDGVNLLNGVENVTGYSSTPTLIHLDWYSDLISINDTISTKRTSAGGFHLDIDLLLNQFEANGTLTTVIDGTVWKQPENGI